MCAIFFDCIVASRPFYSLTGKTQATTRHQAIDSAFKREEQQLRRAQGKAAERNKSAAQDADYRSDYRHTGAVSFHI